MQVMLLVHVQKSIGYELSLIADIHCRNHDHSMDYYRLVVDVAVAERFGATTPYLKPAVDPDAAVH